MTQESGCCFFSWWAQAPYALYFQLFVAYVLQLFNICLQKQMPVPKNQWCCKKEFAEFEVFLDRCIRRRGKERKKHIQKLHEFFCDKVYDITMRQRGYFMEILNEKKTINTRLQSVLNKNSFLEDANATLRQKLAVKGVFSHNLASSNESAS